VTEITIPNLHLITQMTARKSIVFVIRRQKWGSIPHLRARIGTPSGLNTLTSPAIRGKLGSEPALSRTNGLADYVAATYAEV